MTVELAEGVRRMAKQRPVRVVAVTSGKGGVGKTNVSVNVATALSQLGHSALVMDADLGLANVDVLLGLHPKFNLSHVISGECTLEEVIVQAPGGFGVIPASSGIQAMAEMGAAEHAGLVRAFGDLSIDVDVLLVDTAAGISDSVISFSKASQEVIVVVCDEPASITDAYALIKLLNRDHAVGSFRILANMVHSPLEGRELFAKLLRVTDHFLGDVVLDYLGSVPYDEYLRKAIKKQQTVVDGYPQSKAAQSLKEVAKKVMAWPQSHSNEGYLSFFIERLVQGTSSEWGEG